MAILKLKNGKEVLLDEEDYERLKGFVWSDVKYRIN